MRLQIKKLFLVKRDSRNLKSYEFRPGMLNVIIGQGARGKTTVWSIIDYVFCAVESDIDSNIARAVEWVGLMITTPLGDYVLARELKDELSSKSPNFFVKHLEANDQDIDALQISPNTNSAAVKGLLDRVCGVENMTTMADENGQKISFSIRHLLNIVGQDYRTVADQQHLFAWKAPQQWQTLTKYFATIIGVEADTLNLLLADKQKTEKDYKRLTAEYKRALALSNSWKQEMSERLLEAKGLTMIPADVEIPKEVEKCLALVRALIKEAKDKPHFTYNVELLGDLAERVSQCEEKKAGLEVEMAQLQARIENLSELEKKATAIHGEAEKVKDRLEIAKWMMQNWSEYQPSFFRYPYSDGRTAEEVRGEIDRLNETLLRYERTALASDKMLQFRNLNIAEKKRLQERQHKLEEGISSLSREIAALKAKGHSERERIEQYESVNRRAAELIGKFGTMIQLVESLTDTGSLARQIELLKNKIATLEQNVSIEKALVESRMRDNFETLSERSLEIAQGVGLSDSFRFASLQFDVDKLDFKVLYGDSESYLKSRKSTANHVAFHIGVTAALEELCARNEKALLPDFVIYDQPSQANGGNVGGENVGERCFINIATELAKSVRRSQNAWQPILIDSWSTDTLGKLGSAEYHLVADLDESSGLVPADWMQR